MCTIFDANFWKNSKKNGALGLIFAICLVSFATAQVDTAPDPIPPILKCDAIEIREDSFCAVPRQTILAEEIKENGKNIFKESFAVNSSRSRNSSIAVGIYPKGSVIFSDNLSKNYGHRYTTIPYRISDDHTGLEKAEIERAMCNWQKTTVVRFREPRRAEVLADRKLGDNSGRRRVVVFDKGTKGCAVRSVSNGNNVEVNTGSCFATSSFYSGFQTILHEIGHVLGLSHEHIHPLVSNYLKINMTSKIFAEKFDQYGFSNHLVQVRPSSVATLDKNFYDFASVMHYPITTTKFEFEGYSYTGTSDVPLYFEDNLISFSGLRSPTIQRALLAAKVTESQIGHSYCVSLGDQKSVDQIYAKKPSEP
jgi:Astacin (Peptidase family M12A)